MKKTLGVVAVVLTAAIFASCGSSKKAAEATAPAAPAEPTAASVQAARDGVPAWVYEGRRDETGLYAVGAGKLSNKNNSLKMARAEARTELARELKSNVQAATQTYVDDFGDNTNRQSLTGLVDTAVQRTDAMMAGSQQIDYFEDSDGTVYVLMYLPYNAVVPTLNEALSATSAEFTRDETAAFTEQKMAEAYEKYFGAVKKQ